MKNFIIIVIIILTLDCISLTFRILEVRGLKKEVITQTEFIHNKLSNLEQMVSYLYRTESQKERYIDPSLLPDRSIPKRNVKQKDKKK